MKQLRKIRSGRKFTYGGAEWQVLQQEAGRALCLAAGIVENRAFDKENCNDWRESSLRKYLNGEFLENLTEGGASEDAILQTKFDLTSDDGLDDYGDSTDKIGLLSCDQYRKFRKLIAPVNGWWWMLAFESTATDWGIDLASAPDRSTLCDIRPPRRNDAVDAFVYAFEAAGNERRAEHAVSDTPKRERNADMPFPLG